LTITDRHLTVHAMPTAKAAPLRINPTLLRKVAARAKAENRTPTEYIEAALREKLKRLPVTVIVHPKLRKTIRRSKPISRPGSSSRERRQDEELFHWMLDVAGLAR
jgi:hypothetical protein